MNQEFGAKWLICRICLRSENKKLYNIFDPIAEDEIEDLGTILLDKIELCGAIKLNQQRNLPNKICNRCVLLLRAAYKFRDLCQQSQNQLRQFMETGTQKEEVSEQIEIGFDIETEDQITEVKNEVANGELTDESYVIEENVTEYDDSSHATERNQVSKDNNYISVEENDIETQELSDFESSEYIVEEVEFKQYVNEGNDEETIIEYEKDLNDDNIIFEEVSKKSENQNFTKLLIEKKSTVKRKRKQSQSEADKTVYSCMLCDNIYTDKTKYNNHMKIHAKDKPHECEICKKRFSTTPQLSRHMNSHTGNRPYKCQYCEASFGDPSTKIKHERIHTNERPYKCLICNKAFAYSNVLKVHMMTHTGEKPHACEYCYKTFSQIHHKNAHEKRHANVNMVLVQNSLGDECIEEEEDLKRFKIDKII